METPTPASSTLLVQDPIWRELGPRLGADGVTYRVWALGHKAVVVHIETLTGADRTFALKPGPEPGYFGGTDPEGRAGDLYKYAIDGEAPIPDLMSHYQPRGVMGPSMVVDSQLYPWQSNDWQRPAWDGQVVYECHLGTFTPQGTYLSAIEKLDYLADLGITALEIMPVAQAPGDRGWGYDGVMLFAPYHAYGTPDDFRALIDACHLRGIAVILDVVFNHLGPEGNFSHQYTDYFFHLGKDNPWGQNFNLDGPNSEPVRTMLRQNIEYWLKEFRIDGFRMDATHMVHDPSPVHVLAECADIAHAVGGFMIAEDDRNCREVLETHGHHGWEFDGVWSDDFHHIMRVSQTHEDQHFYGMVKGTPEEMEKVLRQGFLFTGQRSSFHQANRGEPCEDFAPQRFVFHISNHDQAGNRLLGDRFHHKIDGHGYRALSLFLCLVPYTPMLFMGQEWGAATPFLYFTDMSEELGLLIADGRRRDFLSSNFARDENDLARMSHPQEIDTFLRSKLNWSELEETDHQRLLHLYKQALKLRRALFGKKNPPRALWKVELQENAVVIRYQLDGRRISLLLHLGDGPAVLPSGATVLLRSNAEEFSGAATCPGVEAIVLDESRP